MKVKELIERLRAEDPEAEVGVSLSRRTGWVQGIAGVKRAEDGTVCLDQAEETLHEDEVRIS